MRLDDFDPNDINVEDQRGQGGGGGFGFGGGGGGGGLLLGLLPMIGSRFGCGGIVVVLILLAVFGGLGNLGSMFGGSQVSAPTAQGAGNDVATSCNLTPQSKSACNAFQSAENTWEQIFQRGVRADSSPGQGIGLAVVTEIVHSYGGEIRVDDSPLGGARLEIRLPAPGRPQGTEAVQAGERSRRSR